MSVKHSLELNALNQLTRWHCLVFCLFSQGFLLRQLWIVNYSVKCQSNNLSNENINTDISKEMIFQVQVHFGILIHILSWNIYFRLLRRNNELKINNLWQKFWHNNWQSIIDVVETSAFVGLFVGQVSDLHPKICNSPKG
jgi:hypothetical protein